jgi:hypothetical protein
MSGPDIIAPAPSSRVIEWRCVVLDSFAPELEPDAKSCDTY